jgi:hypothetical protein
MASRWKKTTTSNDLFIAMTTKTGSLLTGWGAAGTAEKPNDCLGQDKTTCVTRAVTVATTGTSYYCASRNDGSIIASATVGGEQNANFGTVFTSLSIETCAALTTDAANMLVVGGDAKGLAGVSRYTPVGTFDETWTSSEGITGVALAPVNSNLTLAKRVVVQADGTIVVAADASINGLGALGVWRLLPDGTTDKAFAPPNGYATKSVGATNVTVKAMAVDADGRILVAGGNGEMVLARFWQ